MSDHTKNIKDVVKKLPSNYPVGTLYLNGIAVNVVTFSNYSDGLAYFIDENAQVVILDADKIDGINFAPSVDFEFE